VSFPEAQKKLRGYQEITFAGYYATANANNTARGAGFSPFALVLHHYAVKKQASLLTTIKKKPTKIIFARNIHYKKICSVQDDLFGWCYSLKLL